MEGFCSLKSLKEYVKKIINEIGLCENIKDEYPNYYIFFIKLFERHPNYNTKVQNLKNIKIRFNYKFKKQLEVYIEKEDGSITDISVNKCINNNKKDLLYEAMRVSIDYQIDEYRKYNKLICIKCKSKMKPHVDHYNPKFKDLKKNFLIEKNNIPTIFNKDSSNRNCFRNEDDDFENEWRTYHKHNAKLRILCEKCNQEREKVNYKSDSDAVE